MRLVCDEGVDQQIVDELRAHDHDVIYIAEVALAATDEEVLERANREKALLLTTDKDFGELVFRQRRVAQGILLIRLAGLSQQRKAVSVATAVEEYGDDLRGAFAVLEPGRVRIRSGRS